MKIIVTGGTGAMAWPGILYLLDQPDVTELVIADIDSSKVDEKIKYLNDKRVSGAVIDLMNIDEAVKVFEGANVVYNAAWMTTCMSAQKACLKAGVNYVDLGSFTSMDQLEMNEEFKKKNLTAILGCGTAPGMSCIMPEYAVRKLDSVESVHVVDACRDMVPHKEHSRPLYWGFAIEGILEEFTADAPIVENGELKMVPARSGKEVVEFLPPAGRTEVAITTHSEAKIFFLSWKEKGLKEASWKIGFEPEFVQKVEFLTDLGFASDKSIDFNGNKVSPKQMIMHLLNNQKPETKSPTDFRGHMMVIVKGLEGDKKVEYKIIEYATDELTKKMQERGCQGSYRTGIYGGIGALMLARNEISKKGVFYSNSAIDPTSFLREADRVGVEITVNRSERI